MNLQAVAIDPQYEPSESGFGALATELGNLPLQAMDVRANVDGLLFSTTVEQTFVNHYEQALEATYIFPLPDRAAVTSCKLKIGDRVVDGVLQERGQARAAYDAAIAAGQRAAITEEDRAGVFTLRVGNIMPGETAHVELGLSGPVPVDAGVAQWRWPLVVAPRYMPGEPVGRPPVGSGVEQDTTAVPDASRISPPVLLPGLSAPVQLSITLDLNPGGLSIKNIRSSVHAVDQTAGEYHQIKLKPDGKLNRDFVLRWDLPDELDASLLTYATKGDATTWSLAFTAPQGSVQQRPRDVMIVLDRSGSMSGWKMTTAARAVQRTIDSLTTEDRVGVVAFDTMTETPPFDRTLVTATSANKTAINRWIDSVHARGGTQMLQPLARACEALTDPERDRLVVLITDGQVGNEDQILRAIGTTITNIRVYPIGVCSAVNTAFLNRLAEASCGFSTFVESADQLDEAFIKIERSIGTPVLSDLTIEGGAVDPQEILPKRLPDLFAGATVQLFGRYLPKTKRGKMTVTAKDHTGTLRKWSIKPVATKNRAVRDAWARAWVRAAEDEYVIGERDDTDKIVKYSIKYGVLSKFTAFVAIDAEKVNPDGTPIRVTQPVEAPAGWDGSVFARGPLRGGYAAPGAYTMSLSDAGPFTNGGGSYACAVALGSGDMNWMGEERSRLLLDDGTKGLKATSREATMFVQEQERGATNVQPQLKIDELLELIKSLAKPGSYWKALHQIAAALAERVVALSLHPNLTSTTDDLRTLVTKLQTAAQNKNLTKAEYRAHLKLVRKVLTKLTKDLSSHRSSKAPDQFWATRP